VKRSVAVLLLILLIQFGITAAVFWPRQVPVNSSTEQALAPFPDSAIDEVRIGDEFDNEVVLVRSGKQWLLPELEHVPADPVKVDALLHSIIHQTGSWPIARSPAAHQRFQVAAYYYQKRLTLWSQGKKLGAIYLGTSPGFRKVHARNENQDAIYSITLDALQSSALSADWLDPRLLQVRTPLRIDADLYNLYFENGVWRSRTGGAPDEQEVEALMTALKTLQVDGVADEELQRELSAVEADLILKIQSLAGEVSLELLTLNDTYFIHSSQYPLFFKLSAYDFDRLTGLDFRLISGEESRQ
jgi:Domain of unknown function (DUF4340)